MIEDGLRLAVGERHKGRPATRVLPRVSTATGGPSPGIDITDSAALQEMEDLEYVERMKHARMILPDVNVLIYAFRPDAQQHAVGKAWLDDVILGEARFGISRLALAAVVRITTNVRSYPAASSHEDAFGFVRTSSASPTARSSSRASATGTSSGGSAPRPTRAGRASADAWFAALAIEWGCEWITLDRDYSRFAAA